MHNKSHVIIMQLQLLSKILAINNPDIYKQLCYIVPRCPTIYIVNKEKFIIPNIHHARITIHTLMFHDLLQWR